jgi:mRNA-degrading endonuclease RelE of RelBE toxin-antitoxin system
MQVKDLTIEELKEVIRETVIESLEDLLPDRDAGRTVKDKFQQELLEIRQRRKAGTKNISGDEVKQRLRIASR